MSTRWGQPREAVQCYELFGGIALKNHAFLIPSYCAGIMVVSQGIINYSYMKTAESLAIHTVLVLRYQIKHGKTILKLHSTKTT